MQAAFRLADANGLPALTMRALGNHLGVDPTAVYRHFPSRDQILTGRELRVPRCERHADLATQTTKSQRIEPLVVDDSNSGIHELFSSVLPRPNHHRRPSSTRYLDQSTMRRRRRTTATNAPDVNNQIARFMGVSLFQPVLGNNFGANLKPIDVVRPAVVSTIV